LRPVGISETIWANPPGDPASSEPDSLVSGQDPTSKQILLTPNQYKEGLLWMADHCKGVKSIPGPTET
jgi:hypothetical protein